MDIYGFPDEERKEITYEINNGDLSKKQLPSGQWGSKFNVQDILDEGGIPYIEPELNAGEKKGAVNIGADSYTHEAEPLSPEEAEAAKTTHIAFVVNKIQAHLDDRAVQHGYDNIVNACGYAAAPNPFQEESLAFVAWRGEVWDYSYKLLAAIEAGAREEPTVEELLAELPVFPLENSEPVIG